MKNLYLNPKKSFKNPVIAPGKREDAIRYLRQWFAENLDDELIIIDPYFTEDDLSLIKLVQEVKPDCEVRVLSSKIRVKGNKNINSHTDDAGRCINKEIYYNKWKSISSDEPINIVIKIVWDKQTMQCPFHDRWYINEKGNKGLYVGTSFGGLGNRDAQINELDIDGINNVKKLIQNYMRNEISKNGDFVLKYDRFELSDN